MILGIIPAGGKARRWDGYPKELLPSANGVTLLDRTVAAMNRGNADHVMLITNQEKVQMHVYQLGDKVSYHIKSDENLWDSITKSFIYRADWYLFAMPDTYYPKDIFTNPKMRERNFGLGVFDTYTPDRFGVLINGKIRDKEYLSGALPFEAWGTLNWSSAVVNYWISHLDEINSFTDALNLAIKKFSYHTCRMDYYFDMADWRKYADFVREVTEWEY